MRRCPRRLGVRHAVDRARFVQEGGDAERRNISVARIDLRRPDRRDGVDREALRGGEKRVGCAVVGRVEGEIGRHGVGLVPVPDVDARRGSVRGVGDGDVVDGVSGPLEQERVGHVGPVDQRRLERDQAQGPLRAVTKTQQLSVEKGLLSGVEAEERLVGRAGDGSLGAGLGRERRGLKLRQYLGRLAGFPRAPA